MLAAQGIDEVHVFGIVNALDLFTRRGAGGCAANAGNRIAVERIENRLEARRALRVPRARIVGEHRGIGQNYYGIAGHFGHVRLWLGGVWRMKMAEIRRGRLVLSVIVCGQLVGIAMGAPPSFTGLGDLEGGNVLSAAYGVSTDGSVVVGYSHSSFGLVNGDQAFRWTQKTGLEALGELAGGGTGSVARAVSGDGTIVVGDSFSATGDQAFRWTEGTGMVGIGDLPGGDPFSIAYGISADGNVIVGNSSSANSGSLAVEGFRKVGINPIVGIGDLPGSIFFSAAQGASADGSFIAGYGTSTASGASSSEAFRWSAGTGPVGIGDLPGGGFGSNAFAISADGSVVVGIGVSSAGVVAFRWTDPASGGNGMQSIGDLPEGSVFSRANGVSADGTVVVGQSVGANGMEGFVWIQGEGIFAVKQLMIDARIDMTGWTLEVATAVSGDGKTVVGYGPHDGSYEAWVAFLGSPGIKGDVNGDGVVNIEDLLAVIAAWGPCPPPPDACAADVDGNGIVNISDLLLVIGNWG